MYVYIDKVSLQISSLLVFELIKEVIIPVYTPIIKLLF